LQSAALRIKADPGQMEQVIMNLIVNSRDAMPRGGQLTVATAEMELDTAYALAHPGSQPGLYAALTVTDTGFGMDAATQARIFEPFFTTKGPEKGTGLGLATVFGIVQQSGGSIAVSSDLGVGTTFTIFLPRAIEELHRPKARSIYRGSHRGGETILLAEDDDSIRSLTRFILEGNGYKVLEASNGLKALEICTMHKDPIDILVSDVVMPNMSGPELAHQAGSMRRAMKVLYLSGYTDDAVVRYGTIDADTPYLQKPFTPHTLLAKVREVLDTVPQLSSM
jgi:two-component system cell cycle sensor histidine kinase/response regulator CckA